jgi:hypothetical protein
LAKKEKKNENPWQSSSRPLSDTLPSVLIMHFTCASGEAEDEKCFVVLFKFFRLFYSGEFDWEGGEMWKRKVSRSS